MRALGARVRLFGDGDVAHGVMAVMERSRIDMLMGIGGATAEGFSNTNTLVVSPQRKMIEVSRKVIIVADHTKFGRRAVMHLAPLDMADVVVSDAALPAEFQEMLREREVQVLLA